MTDIARVRGLLEATRAALADDPHAQAELDV